MNLKKYLTEKFVLHQSMKHNGQKYSEPIEFRDKKEAQEILEIERKGDAGMDYDNTKELYYFDDDGNTYEIIKNGKLSNRKIKIK